MTVLPAQCAYPQIPRGGFAITERLDVPIAFLDGARTKVDLYFPTQRVPCGWPVLLYMHGMGQDRTRVRREMRRLAGRGYGVAVWDVRGQGEAIRLNSPQFGYKYVGDTERLDVVEVVAFLRRNYAPDMDVRRLGMLGVSQGAMYCWAAAAWSGRALPANSRGLTRFPEFRAVCPLWWAPLTGDVLVREGKAFTGRLFSVLYEFTQHVVTEPTWYARMDQMLRAEDFAGLAAFFNADPFRQELALLPTSKVPVFTQVSWNDDWVPLEDTLAVFRRMPASTPKRAFLTFPGHDGPRKVKPMQGEITKKESDRWLDRFLKDVRNGVEHEAPFVVGAMNQTDAEFRGWDPVWNRYHFQWPPPGRQQRTWYLRSGNALSPNPPTSAEPADRVRHAVPANYDMAAYIGQEGHVFNVLRTIPTSSVPFDTAPLTTDFEIAGRSKVVVEVDPTGKNYQLHCALYRVEPSGTELFLASGAALVRAQRVAPTRLEVTMNHVDAIVRKGQRLRLRLENLTYRKAVDTPNLMVAPYFESVDMHVRHERTATGARLSSLTVPLLPYVAPALVTSHLELDVSGQPVADVWFRVAAPTYDASTPYVLVFSSTGMSPGYSWAGRHVHMNWDPFLSNAFLSLLNTPVLPNALGVLGSQVTASPRLALRHVGSIPPAARGLRFIAVGSLADGNITNPVSLYLR